ncbi:MAG: hypothetical protein L0Y71_01665 [Gemmataceae bacterium]|nr:hypothetical protein [Gemmataceae bacterium]
METGILDDAEVIHRFGTISVETWRLRESDKLENPPGLSVLIGGTAEDAAAAMLEAYADKRKYSRIHEMIKKTNTTSVLRIRQSGFDVVAAPTKRFANHGRVIHPQGSDGFTDENLQKLMAAFAEGKP